MSQDPNSVAPPFEGVPPTPTSGADESGASSSSAQPRLRLTLGTLLALIGSISVLFALFAELSKMTSQVDILWPLAALSAVVVFSLALGVGRRSSWAVILGQVTLTSALLILLAGLLQLSSPVEEYMLHFWIMLGLMVTLIVPVGLRRHAKERMDAGPRRDRALAVASALFGTL